MAKQILGLIGVHRELMSFGQSLRYCSRDDEATEVSTSRKLFIYSEIPEFLTNFWLSWELYLVPYNQALKSRTPYKY